MNNNSNITSHPSPSLYGRVGVGLLYTLLIVCMGLATIIEKVQGKSYVDDAIYGSWWFITLWGILTIVALAFIIKNKMQKRWAVFMLHISFVVMLIGALVTHLTAESGTIHLREGVSEHCFIDNTNKVQRLPFTMTLTNFEIQNYSGTDAVMDYRCDINVKRNSEVEKMNVSMNNIGKADGYRFYQSAYDSDGHGTRLLVAHDPYGIAITYFGYLMLFISLLWTLFSKHTRIRELYRIVTKPLIVTILLCLGNTLSANAETAITLVSKEIAHEFGKVVTHYNGRLCPINTAAVEFVTKLSGKPSWNGYSADEVFVSWMIYYSEWEQQKIIRIKNAEVQQMLGIEGKWASVSDFYTPNNIYKLTGKANDISLPDATRKAIREADEKIQVVTMFYNSEMLRIFPLENQPQNLKTSKPQNLKTPKPQNLKTSKPQNLITWHTPGSTELPQGIPEKEFQFINHAMDHLVKSILVNDVEGARLMIAKIKLYQKEKAGDVMPSQTKVSIEVLYNTLQSARWIVFLLLTLSIIIAFQEFHIIPNVKRSSAAMQILQSLPLYCGVGGGLLFLTTLAALRWIVSGHIPMSNGFETMLFMSWITLVITVAIMRKIPVMRAFGPLVASFCMLVAMLAVGNPQITPLMPVLQSPLLTIHVAMVMIAYALLALITLVAIQGLVLAKRQQTAELTRMTALSQLMLYPAVALLTMGIFVGAVWANVSWGTYWSWDPKETWALITLMIYAVPLHRSFMSDSPKAYHWYILLAFLTVLMTYFGVNYFLSGMHSYA